MAYDLLKIHIVITTLFAVRISAENGKTFNQFRPQIFQQVLVYLSPWCFCTTSILYFHITFIYIYILYVRGQKSLSELWSQWAQLLRLRFQFQFIVRTFDYFHTTFTNICSKDLNHKSELGQIAAWCWTVNTLRPRQNGRHFADDMFMCIFLNENVWIPIEISLKFVPKGSINNKTALFQIMAWRRPGDKPLSEPIMVCSLTHICVTRPQWVNKLSPEPFRD